MPDSPQEPPEAEPQFVRTCRGCDVVEESETGEYEGWTSTVDGYAVDNWCPACGPEKVAD